MCSSNTCDMYMCSLRHINDPVLLSLKMEGIRFFYFGTYLSDIFDVHKSVHHHTIRVNQPTRCNSFTSLLLDVYVWLNMFWASPRPSSGAYNCTRSLWFYRWSVVVGALLVVVWQTTTNNAPTASLQRQNQRLLVQLYAPDDGRKGSRNMLNHT
jgi:hypothetical protein